MTHLSNSGSRRYSLTLALACTSLCSAAALAARPDSLEEIIVTAQKRSEKLSETPVSVTALSSQDLDALAARQFRDFANTVPNLNYTTSGVGETQITLRGITTGAVVSQTVAIYVDEVPYGSSTPFASGAQLGLDVGLFDVSRIEIVRGPQGTLYGTGAMGGILKYVTNLPASDDFSVAARAGLAATDDGGTSYDASAVLNAPVGSSGSALRLSGYYSKDGGYIDNIELGQDDVNEADVYGGRADFLYSPSDALSVRLVVFAQDIDRDGSITADYDLATGQPIDGDLEQRRLLPEFFDQEFRLASGTVTYDFGAATLTSVTSYQTVDTKNSFDISALYVPILAPALLPPPPVGLGIVLGAMDVFKRNETDKFTQEFRLDIPGERVDWLLGAFYTDEDSGQVQDLAGYDASGAQIPLNFFHVSIPSTYEEIAGFATATWHVSDKLDLAGGLRYAHNEQEQEQIGTSDLNLIGSTPKRDTSEDVVTWMANARYKINDNLMPYVRVATGYRPGGPNLVANDPVTGIALAPPTFDSDDLISYEAGIKASTADRRVSVDVAVFYIDWDDLQIGVSRNGLGVIANATAATSTGAELTVTALPTEQLTLTGAFGYAKAELAEDSPIEDLGGFDGDPLPDTPELTAAISGDYDFMLAGLDASVGAAVRYIDDRVASFDENQGTPQYHLPDYTTVDLRGAIDFGAARVQLYVRNVGDERGQLAAATQIALAGGPAQISILQPRTYGISVDVGF